MWGLVLGGAFGICEAGRASVPIGAQDQNRKIQQQECYAKQAPNHPRGLFIFTANGLLLSKCVCILHKQTLVVIILMLSLQMNTYLPLAN